MKDGANLVIGIVGFIVLNGSSLLPPLNLFVVGGEGIGGSNLKSNFDVPGTLGGAKVVNGVGEEILEGGGGGGGVPGGTILDGSIKGSLDGLILQTDF